MRKNSMVGALAASLIALLPVHAFAQEEEAVSVRDRPREEYAPQGARLGAFTLNASIDFTITSTDNLFAAESGVELDDMIYTVSPTARLVSDWSRHQLVLEAGATTRSHEDFSNEDTDENFLRGAARLDVTSSTILNASARMAHQVTPRTDPDSPLIGEPVEYDRTDFTVGGEHRFARGLFSLEAGTSEYDYDGSQNFRDNDENNLRGRLEFEASPRFGLLFEATTDERDYDNTPSLNNEGQTLLAGVTLNTNLMRGEIAVGQFERDYDDPTVGTLDGTAVAGELEWYITPLTTITFDARRDADDQISATVGLPYTTEEVGARVDHELRRNIILSATYRMGERDYGAYDRDDEFNEIELGADYILNRRVAISARYNRDESESTGALATRDFEVNQVSLGLSLRL